MGNMPYFLIYFGLQDHCFKLSVLNSELHKHSSVFTTLTSLKLNLHWQYNSCVIINFQHSLLSILMVTQCAMRLGYNVDSMQYLLIQEIKDVQILSGTEESISPHQSVAVAAYLSPVQCSLLIGTRVSTDTFRKGEGPMEHVNCLSGIIYLNTQTW